MRAWCCALVLITIPHTACVPPAASPTSSTIVVSEPLVMSKYGDIHMGKRLIRLEDLEEITRCNPTAHAEAVVAERLDDADWVFLGSTVGGLTASLWMLGAMALSDTPKQRLQAGVVGIVSSAVSLVSLIVLAALPRRRTTPSNP